VTRSRTSSCAVSMNDLDGADFKLVGMTLASLGEHTYAYSEDQTGATVKSARLGYAAAQVRARRQGHGGHQP
jgi:hypothetical protein